MKEAVRTSETSVYFNETTRHYIPEAFYLHGYSVLYLIVIRKNGNTIDQWSTVYRFWESRLYAPETDGEAA
jgi:hypothetical protein